MISGSDSASAHPNRDTSLLTPADALPTGTVLAGRFRVVSTLGAGGQAQVYQARDEILGTDIAIKLIAPRNALDINQVQRLRQEVLMARELNHPNIVRVFEFYQDGEWVFFTMGLVSGRCLAELIHEGVKRQQVELWLNQLLLALAACHDAGITHADIKPENIVVDERGNIILLDFGIGQTNIGSPEARKNERNEAAEKTNSTLFASGAKDFSASTGYAAPEVTQLGKRGSHSDCYSCGLLLKELLGATSIRKWHLGDLLWYLECKQIAGKLSKPLIHQRLSIAGAQKRLLNPSKPKLAFSLAVLVCVLSLVVYAVWQQANVEPPVITAEPERTSRVAIIYSPDNDTLAGFAELMRLHLISQSDIDVIEQNRVDILMSNLGLRPFGQQEHRNRIAQLVNADVLVLLQTMQLPVGEEVRLQVVLASMPGNRMFGAFQGTLSNELLPQTLEQLFTHIDTQLALPPRELIVPVEELQRVEPVLRALRQGRNAEAEQFINSLQAEWPDFAGGWLAGARLAVNRGELQQAREQLQRLFELSENDEYWHLEGRALQAEMSDDINGAIAVVDRLVELFPGRATLLDRRAELATWDDDAETAINLYQQALIIDPSSGERWFELARIRIIQGQIQQALDNELLQALIKYRQQEDVRGQGTVLNAFGVAYLRLSEAGQAAQYFTQALQIRTAEFDPNGRAVTLANLANAYALQLRYNEAEAALAEASLLFEANNDRLGLAQVENEWGILLEEQGRYREALTHYSNALDLRIATGYSRQQAESINNVAYIYYVMAEYSQAEIFWNQAATLFSRIGDESGLARTELNLANLALTRGEYNKATQILSDVLEKSQGRRPEEELVTQFYLSHRNFSLGAWETATYNNQEALRISELTNNVRGIVEVRIWGAEMCLYFADSQCMDEHLEGLTPYIEQLNQEQLALRDWIITAKAILEGEVSTSGITAFWARFRKQLLPVKTELRVLLSVLELSPTARDSWQWQRVRELSTASMYKEYLRAHYLQALQFNDENAREQLRRTLQSYPEHWRNHLYYEIFDDLGSKRRAEQLQEALYQHLTQPQIEVYQATYERTESSVRRRSTNP
ncbi:protein kinase family protein [Idiomarina sp. A28L]|uniref:serine/threonine-protein kinase n=1 Tax=Idiomarina sp. A28L TaxID=1036674 RepID=UPI0002138E51|nr:serine/threonine-protein kinase [Idiomarina sp. A28L]EGN75567.1 protein kinase family protein [Idiomarina sp. A28L]